MSKHTPGPWAIDGRGYRPDTLNGGSFVPVISANRATGRSWVADVREPEGNAHLIAAAPELAHELRETTDAIERMALRLDQAPGNQTVVELWMMRVRRNREVLAKAEGEV